MILANSLHSFIYSSCILHLNDRHWNIILWNWTSVTLLVWIVSVTDVGLKDFAEVAWNCIKSDGTSEGVKEERKMGTVDDDQVILTVNKLMRLLQFFSCVAWNRKAIQPLTPKQVSLPCWYTRSLLLKLFMLMFNQCPFVLLLTLICYNSLLMNHIYHFT